MDFKHERDCVKKLMICVCLVFIFAIGCGKSDSPSTVVKKFYEAVEKNDTKAIAKYSTPETVSLLAMFGTKMQGEVAKKGKIQKTTEKINNDEAVVDVTFNNGENSEMKLIKVNGEWKVNISMEK